MTEQERNKPRWRWLRFSLRTLLLVMCLICLVLGRVVERARKQQEAVAWVRAMGGQVTYPSAFSQNLQLTWLERWYLRNDDGDPFGSRPQITWLEKQLGVDFFNRVISVQVVNGEMPGHGPLGQLTDVSPLAALTHVQWLDLRGTRVVDLSPLARMTELKSLDLSVPWTHVPRCPIFHH
jgi:hypothetical protein